MLKTFTLLYCTLFSVQVSASQSTEVVNNERMSGTEKFVNYIEETLPQSGYVDITYEGFDVSRGAAFTTLHEKGGGIDLVRAIEIYENPPQAFVYFRIYSDCIVSESVLQKVITVNDQRIKTDYVCRENQVNNDRLGPTQQLYIPLSDAAKQLVVDELSENAFVFIRFEPVLIEIPFSTKGFKDVWERVNKPVL